MLAKIKSHKLFLVIFKVVFTVIGLLPKKKKLMIFESFHGKQYSDSPRAIYEYMKKHYPDYELLWSIDKRSTPLFQDFKVPHIQRFTPVWFLMKPRAKYWINNVRTPGWMPKPRGTVYVQTWHGTPLKKLGLDIEEVHMPGTETNTYRNNILTESANWSYLVSPNQYSTEIFKSAFGYKGDIVESGYPRNDILYNATPEKVKAVKSKLEIPLDKKVVLYAPTWRDDDFYAKGQYKFSFQFDLERMKEQFGDEFVLLTRMHYLVAESFDFTAYEGFVKDVSVYPDIAELYLISDLLITDYSSVFFDYANLERPIIFYMYDLEDYRDRLRGFYFDIEQEAPGPIVMDEASLFNAIEQALRNGHGSTAAFQDFYQRFCYIEDGHSTERLINKILKE
ncbi:CDP-glycerol glycerophosphotransferase family protein [Sporosarcina pasteurii]|uniref:CDP-glycerol:poly(Glycerophosphate) glycerophosphotransferase n=1 Tax=Sporosarcina pasteurii TaxID=1474 RepID=A0A380BCR9_SPOPA|nr:CDP-glycerol glycerophosphotransferase family protein [Sporosarcina pasteurii]MDS9472230.1 CDP-glycerol glycerophosphotransferase family protein [Sporosarcina pasteurii]QBQ06215.1 CDP-glycerol glycerophosphotransferase family protein [Sporosarcina pasteurii]SUI99172.1 CDP-glycerol:poly(glycerophosphate) glycerophosphotransferase [Sporosarcina pasteurii]